MTIDDDDDDDVASSSTQTRWCTKQLDFCCFRLPSRFSWRRNDECNQPASTMISSSMGGGGGGGGGERQSA